MALRSRPGFKDILKRIIVVRWERCSLCFSFNFLTRPIMLRIFFWDFFFSSLWCNVFVQQIWAWMFGDERRKFPNSRSSKLGYLTRWCGTLESPSDRVWFSSLPFFFFILLFIKTLCCAGFFKSLRAFHRFHPVSVGVGVGGFTQLTFYLRPVWRKWNINSDILWQYCQPFSAFDPIMISPANRHVR